VLQNKLFVMYGNDPRSMAYELMSRSDIKSRVNKDMRVGIKPNLVVAKPSESGATTSPELVEGIISYLKDNGIHNITIMEGSWVGDSTKRAFKVCGYDRLSSKYGIPLVDLKKDKSKVLSYKGNDIRICTSALECDFLINAPVLKAHCQTSLTCALKNMKGCIPDSEKRRFHTLGLHGPIALLNKFLRPHLTIVDGIMGDLTFEEGGTPVEMNRVILGTDPVLIDAYAAQLLGYTIDDIPYIKKAEQFGVGSSAIDDSTVVEINKDCAPSGKINPCRKVARLAEYILEDQACSACYGSLIHALNRLDENGCLRKLKQKVHIGQGFKGQQNPGIGIGNCTSGFVRCVRGCPPKARDIVEMLEDV
jgi:uncharacterized protein (DUF362 family)